MPEPDSGPDEVRPDVDRYLRQYGLRCPFCDSDNIATDSPVSIDESGATQQCVCDECGREWADLFRLIGIAPADEHGNLEDEIYAQAASHRYVITAGQYDSTGMGPDSSEAALIDHAEYPLMVVDDEERARDEARRRATVLVAQDYPVGGITERPGAVGPVGLENETTLILLLDIRQEGEEWPCAFVAVYAVTGDTADTENST